MIESEGLYYAFNNGTVGLTDIQLKLPSRSRTLLLGANGAGKSTLLRVLAGKTLPKAGKLQINGSDPFRQCTSGITYLGTEWAANTTVRRDVAVVLLLASVGGDAYPERRDELIDILDVDLRWRMNQVSDGERRRVQLCMGLLQPWTTLLLDEVTVDLDVLVRARLLDFLHRETEERDCQIVYATHIFDGLTGWPTHLVHMHLGSISDFGPALQIIEAFQAAQPTDAVTLVHRGTPLMELALTWLQQDLKTRGTRDEKVQWKDVANQVEHALDHGANFSEYFKATRGPR